MQLRHIRPRSVEWYDAVLVEDLEGSARLGPERAIELRALWALGDVGRGVTVRITQPVRRARRLARAA
jgi:hypothetical protein